MRQRTSSTKNKAKARDPEMSSTKKGNDWYIGMKVHLGVDVESGIVHQVFRLLPEVGCALYTRKSGA